MNKQMARRPLMEYDGRFIYAEDALALSWREYAGMIVGALAFFVVVGAFLLLGSVQ